MRCFRSCINDATISIQRQYLTMGDFYRAWLKWISSTESTFLKKLLGNMKIREQKLFKNTVFLTVVFIDPRYVFLLNDWEIAIAWSHLKKTRFRYKATKINSSIQSWLLKIFLRPLHCLRVDENHNESIREAVLRLTSIDAKGEREIEKKQMQMKWEKNYFVVHC